MQNKLTFVSKRAALGQFYKAESDSFNSVNIDKQTEKLFLSKFGHCIQVSPFDSSWPIKHIST